MKFCRMMGETGDNGGQNDLELEYGIFEFASCCSSGFVAPGATHVDLSELPPKLPPRVPDFRQNARGADHGTDPGRRRAKLPRKISLVACFLQYGWLLFGRIDTNGAETQLGMLPPFLAGKSCPFHSASLSTVVGQRVRWKWPRPQNRPKTPSNPKKSHFFRQGANFSVVRRKKCGILLSMSARLPTR